MHRIDEKFGKKMLRKKPLRRPSLKWDGAINMCCNQMNREGVD